MEIKEFAYFCSMLHSFTCGIASGGKNIAQRCCFRPRWYQGAGISINYFGRSLSDLMIFLWTEDELIQIFLLK